jgi:hypothetical protein
MVKAWKSFSIFPVVVLIFLLAPAAVLVEPAKNIVEASGVVWEVVGKEG